MHIVFYFLIFLFFSQRKTCKVDFVGKKKTTKNPTPPKTSTPVSFLFLIVAVELMFGQHFCDSTCNMFFTDDMWCLYMYIKHSAKCMTFHCKVGFADENRAFKVRHLELLELSFEILKIPSYVLPAKNDQALHYLLKPKSLLHT